MLNGHQVTPLLECPWVTKDIIRPDWLHCADLGVTPKFIGNVFLDAVASPHYFEGSTQKARVKSLWRDIQKEYLEHNIEDRLSTLTLKKIRPDKKGPHLSGTAACIRALVPYTRKLAARMASIVDSPVNRCIAQAALRLKLCYDGLSSTTAFNEQLMKDNGKQFLLQYGALRKLVRQTSAKSKRYHIVPKFHLFLHLIEAEGNPALRWTYRDEAFGGTLARMARRRAGKNTAQGMSTRVLNNFRIKEPLCRVTLKR